VAVLPGQTISLNCVARSVRLAPNTVISANAELRFEQCHVLLYDSYAAAANASIGTPDSIEPQAPSTTLRLDYSDIIFPCAVRFCYPLHAYIVPCLEKHGPLSGVDCRSRLVALRACMRVGSQQRLGAAVISQAALASHYPYTQSSDLEGPYSMEA
jgi:hypothetical protein